MLSYKLFKTSNWRRATALASQQYRYFSDKNDEFNPDSGIYEVEETSTTPFDEEFFKVDKMAEEEQEAVLGIAEYEKSQRL